MRRFLRHRPSPAMVVACVALAIALGGTSYAAIKLPKNSVGAKQLKKHAVKRSKIAAKAVNGSKVAADSLTGVNILESSLSPVPSATNATHATSADSATNAGHADSATNAGHATSADSATNATHATTADSVPALSFANLRLKNSWAGNCFDGGVPAIARSSEGVVYFRGEMCGTIGGSSNPFDVPPGFVPSKIEGIPVAQAGGTGLLTVFTNGTVDVSDDPDHPDSAAHFTSLDGVSYTLPY